MISINKFFTFEFGYYFSNFYYFYFSTKKMMKKLFIEDRIYNSKMLCSY